MPSSPENLNKILDGDEVTWKYRLKFGKYKGRTLEDVLDKAPEYLDWLLDQELETYPSLKKFLRSKQQEIWNNIPDQVDEHEDWGDRD